MPDLSADFPIRVLDRVHIHVSIAFFNFADEVPDRLPSKRADQIPISQNAAYDTPPDRNAEFGRTEQEGDDRTVLSSAAEMDMGLGNPCNVPHHKPKMQSGTVSAKLKNGIAGRNGSDRRYFFASSQKCFESSDMSSLPLMESL
ncbi:MAG: hypothetical protein K0R28_6124 [Paenibacillus sp.]|nr:hypothetical protein [Paenibacillus sp.]